MREERASPDLLASKIASRQHGVICVDQLLECGIDKDGALRRARAGRLHRLHRGVYAVGHRAISRQGRWMAAVLAVGRGPSRAAEPLQRWGTAVSHRSAAELWGLLESRDGPVDVALPGDGGKRRRQGIRLHRSPSLLPAHTTLRDGIPVTTTARTLSDLRRVLPRRELRRAFRQAEVVGLPLGAEFESDRTRSDLERDFLRLCRRYRLPPPEVNVPIGRDLVDFLWRERRLVVETDGYRYHRGRVAFEDDRARDLRLRALGFEAIRVSDAMLNEEPERVAETLGAALRVGADGDQGP